MIWLLWLGCTEPPPPPAKPPAPDAVIAPPDANALLPEDPNRALVVGQCTVCHSARLIAQNHMSRDRWDATLTWMQQTQGLWPLPDDQRGRILDYLAAHFGPLTEAGSDGPWAQPRYQPNPLWTDG